MLSSFVVAQVFLQLAKSDKTSLTPAATHSLAYFAHGLHLGLFGTPLLDEKPTAWDFGPIVPELFNAMGQFREKYLPYELPLVGGGHVDRKSSQYKSIDAVWRSYGTLGAAELRKLSTMPGSPWDQSWNRELLRFKEIPESILIRYYGTKNTA